MTEDRRDAIMRKVQALLNKAESTTFGPEQEALLQKADRLMIDYAIAQHEIDSMLKPGERVKPEKRKVDVCSANNHLYYELCQLCMSVCEFFDCKSVYTGLNFKGKVSITATVVGFPESVRAAEQLFTSLKLQLMSVIHPKWSYVKSLDDNVVFMKDSGQTWSYIYAELQRAEQPIAAGPEERNKLGRIKRIYDRRKSELGEQPTKANPKNFQTNFSNGFIAEVGERMSEIKRLRKQSAEEETTSDGTSVALVLRSREEEVAEAFHTFFPSLGRGVGKSSSKFDMAAQAAGRAAGSSADLSGATRNVGGTKGALS